ncbi:MAG TPA: 16S rRNA (cytosine(967)-C(5))-methyltransferase RsmB [Pyrinomonadaceae bacterium]
MTNSANRNSKIRNDRLRSGISPARLAAYQILKRVEEDGAYASVLLAVEDDLSERDRSLTYELTMGVLRRQLMLDCLIEHYANRDPARLDTAIRRILRLALYQLRHLSRVPASAAVNEAVNLTRFARLRSADKFVNAVLRRAVREPDYDPLALIADPLERIAVETSHPRWLFERWSREFGLADAHEFAKANNEVPATSFRIVAEKTTNDTVEQLRKSGATLTRSAIAKDAWIVSGNASTLRQLVRAGSLYLQDEASQLVSQLAAPLPGEWILDLCAAPGSKTTHLASLADNKAHVMAGDLYEHRLRLILQAAQLQRVTRVDCILLDGERPPFREMSFDRVLVDAPCSGTGTLRRNPEIRWRISPADIEELSTRQKGLLHESADVVKPGGRLVYSTCSVEVEENEMVVANFLQRHSDFLVIQPDVDPALTTGSGAVRTWPHRDGSDGFFICVFERRP